MQKMKIKGGKNEKIEKKNYERKKKSRKLKNRQKLFLKSKSNWKFNT